MILATCSDMLFGRNTLGVAAIARAVELGDATSEVHRIEAGLLSMQITGWASALRLNQRIDTALTRAAEIEPTNPRVQVALGCRKLFAPRLLGHDPEGAFDHFGPAAEALTVDERPLMFAAMAAWLTGDVDRATRLVERATARNPNNAYAAEVARRIAAGVSDPFADDVESK